MGVVSYCIKVADIESGLSESELLPSLSSFVVVIVFLLSSVFQIHTVVKQSDTHTPTHKSRDRLICLLYNKLINQVGVYYVCDIYLESVCRFSCFRNLVLQYIYFCIFNSNLKTCLFKKMFIDFFNPFT